MEQLTYNIVANEGEPSSVMVFMPGGKPPLTATSGHQNFEAICTALKSGETDMETITDLFDASAAISKQFARVGDRVSINGSLVYLDLEPLENNVLTEVIVRYYRDGSDNFQPLVNFLEKVMQNPNAHSRENLYRWIAKHRFMIAPDGDIIAYKGVNRQGDHWVSSNPGEAAVNGEMIQGRIPNLRDAIIEMPRSEVQHDPSRGCHTGLHVGNWRYARSFASTTIRVKLNPRDVVSVPTDCNDEKMRVCRYRVMGEVTSEDTSMLFATLPQRTRVTTRINVQEIADKAAPKVYGAKAKVAVDPAAAAEKAKQEANPKRARRAAKNAVKAAPKLPKYYEQYTKAQFESLDFGELRWIAKEWEVKIDAPVTKVKIVAALIKEAKVRLRTW